MDPFYLKLGTLHSVHYELTVQQWTRVHGECQRQEKEKNTNRKERTKLSVFEDVVIQRKLKRLHSILGLVIELCKVAEYQTSNLVVEPMKLACLQVKMVKYQ